ncbi:MAG TPA: tetratricopeptide repeat protein [Candidatus Hydrogenedentes bacterium]|nr:tetratricopeptide repeat protein [Candidatus Hydrogenedentota bacterium]
MNQHRWIWLAALLAAALATALAALRHTGGARDRLLPSPEDAVAQAIALLEADPMAAQRETQSAVRTAAVYAERGLIATAEACYALALQYHREDNPPAAEALYKRAIALRPDWNRPYVDLGGLLGRHTFGRNEEATEALKRAIEIDPEWARPYNILAIILRMENRLEEAEEAALTALRLDPEDIASNNNYGNLLLTQGRLEEAEQYYVKATELNPDHPKPYYNLACLHSLLGHPEAAIEYLRESIRRSSMLRGDSVFDPHLDAIRDHPEFQRLLYGEEESDSE